MIGPIIKDLVDTSVRNDESLIKMAAIAQRMIASKDKTEGDTGFLSDKEKEQLLLQPQAPIGTLLRHQGRSAPYDLALLEPLRPAQRGTG